MTIAAITIKLFGKKANIYRVMRAGQVVQVFDSLADAEAWAKANK